MESGVLFKGRQIQIPQSMQKEILQQLHQIGTPMGREDSQSCPWHCILCKNQPGHRSHNASRATHVKRTRWATHNEPLMPHTLPTRHWQYIASDLFKINRKQYLLTIDRYTKYQLVDYMPNPVNSHSISEKMKTYCAMFGRPDEIMPDGGVRNTQDIIIIIIIIIRQPLCPVVGRRPQHAVSKLPCLVLSSAISCRSSICPGRLSIAWLVSLVVFSCHMVSNWWHARSIGRLWGGWYALPRTISFFLQCWLYLWLLSSPWPRCWSFCLCMWCWAYFFPFLSVRPQVCSVLVWSVSMSLHHMS